MNTEEILRMNTEEILRLIIKDFIRNGGVVLATNNDGQTFVGAKGSVVNITESFTRTLVKLNLTIIKENPKDFRIFTATVITHLLAIAEIAESEFGVPQLSEQTARLVAAALHNKDVARHAVLSVKHMMKELQGGVEE